MIDVRKLDRCLDEHQQRLEDFVHGPSEELAEALCRLSRRALSTYLHQWVYDHLKCTADRQGRLARLLRESQRHVADFHQRGADGLSGRHLAKLEKYAESIEFRGKLLKLLHEPDDPALGAEAVRREIEARDRLLPQG